MKADWRFRSFWKDGQWDEGGLFDSDRITISESSTSLHYGQQCFEGLKAYTGKDGSLHLFRPDENAKRMQATCDRILMPHYETDKFIEACREVVKSNRDFVPPYGFGATFYLRPYMIGIGDNIGVKPAPEFLFSVFGLPVGAYFKAGLAPVKIVVTDFDRAAPNGTGAAKVGGNYAGSLLPHEHAVRQGYADCIYLDPATHTNIEEVGAANFFGITHDGVFVTPKSPSILPSITKMSLITIARDYLDMKVEERDVPVSDLDIFAEAGACGTAAVITPISSITYKGKEKIFYSETEVGPVTRKLYDTLTGIQFGEIEAPKGWIFEV
jgi:branched-chain amino acid aminotransferase